MVDDIWLVEWRPPSGSPILNGVVAGREAALRLVEQIVRDGAALDDAFRIRRIGGPAQVPLHVDLAALRRWSPDRPLPEGCGTPWSSERSAEAVRGRSRRTVRDALVAAWRDGALEREQVADLLSTLEQAFDGLGSASRRLPSRH